LDDSGGAGLDDSGGMGLFSVGEGKKG